METKPLYDASLKDLNPATPTKAKPISRGHALDEGNILEEVIPYLGPDCSGRARKVMVVVDSTKEAKRALLWVLSHALRKHDSLILLHLTQERPECAATGYISSKDSNALDSFKELASFKELCIERRPEVELEVEVIFVGGKDKGPTIVEQAKNRSVSLLVLGQPKGSFMTRLRAMLTGGSQRSAAAVVEYCIENSECTTVAVKEKNKKEGGYIISTKKHKNFWLLA